MEEESGRGSGRVRLFVRNRGSGRVKVSPGRVGSKKSDPWTTLQCGAFVADFLINTCCIPSGPYDFMQSPQEGQVSTLSNNNLLWYCLKRY